jgi:hypothetical protein
MSTAMAMGLLKMKWFEVVVDARLVSAGANVAADVWGMSVVVVVIVGGLVEVAVDVDVIAGAIVFELVVEVEVVVATEKISNLMGSAEVRVAIFEKQLMWKRMTRVMENCMLRLRLRLRLLRDSDGLYD